MTTDYDKPATEYFSKQQDYDKPAPEFFRKQGNQWTPVDSLAPASHPITPPPELMEQWMQVHNTKYDLARQAAQWGADQELEACRMGIIDGAGLFYIDETSDRVRLAEDIWTARRPKQMSLKEQALMALEDGDTGPGASLTSNEVDIIRRALEQLDD